MYAAAFMIVVLMMDETLGSRMILSFTAILALPAAFFISAAFSAMAVCITSFARKVEDFDIVMGLVVTPMFLFSGVFFPITQFPTPLQWLVQIGPLYHGVELLRQLTTGAVTPALFAHAGYLALIGTAAFIVAMHRLERELIK